MLNLIYYDLKATIKKLWIYILLIAVFAFIVRLIWSGVLGGVYADDNELFYIADIVKYVALGVMGVLGFLVSITIIVCQAKWFDENILSPQGQLTNMLPVASWQIMLSKILTALFWSFVLVVMAIGSSSIFLVKTEIFEDFAATIMEIGAKDNINISLSQIIFSASFFVITFFTVVITICFLSQLIGQIFDNFRNFWILISFILIIVVSLFLLYILGNILGISLSGIPTDYADIINFAISSATKISILNLLLIAGYWSIGSYILNNKLNLL